MWNLAFMCFHLTIINYFGLMLSSVWVMSPTLKPQTLHAFKNGPLPSVSDQYIKYVSLSSFKTKIMVNTSHFQSKPEDEADLKDNNSFLLILTPFLDFFFSFQPKGFVF